MPPLTLEVTLEKEVPVPPTSLSKRERGVLRQGGVGDSVPKPHRELICSDLRAKDWVQGSVTSGEGEETAVADALLAKIWKIRC